MAADVDEIFADVDGSDTPGCVVGVQRDDRLAFSKAYGQADLSAGTPLTTDTRFDLASVSKQLTAATVLLLAGEGLVDLGRDVRSYVPGLPDYGSPVTIEQLIHHTGGLPDYIELMFNAGFEEPERTTDADAFTVLSTAPRLRFRPGTRHEYDNTGYFLLAAVVQAATGRSLREVAGERLFQPLGMGATSFRDATVDTPAGTALAYQPHGNDWELQVSEWRQVGDGGVFSTVGDLLRWAANFWTRRVGGHDLFKAMTAKGRLADGSTFDYGAGIEVEDDGELSLSHTGSWAGYRSALIVHPKDRMAVAVLCNNASEDVYDHATETLDLFE